MKPTLLATLVGLASGLVLTTVQTAYAGDRDDRSERRDERREERKAKRHSRAVPELSAQGNAMGTAALLLAGSVVVLAGRRRREGQG